MVTPFVLPSLSSVLERIWTDAASGELFINTGLTLYRALVGFAIACVGGIVLGMPMSRNAIAHWFFDPIVSVGFPMPKIAFLPVVILWLGVYDVSKITMVVHRRDLPGGHRDHHRHPGRRHARSDLVGAQHGRRATASCCGRSCCRRRCRRS